MAEGSREPAAEDAKSTGAAGEPGIGHNRPAAEWKRWTKKRTFVHALEGTYSNLLKGLHDLPRVYSTRDYKWHGGPQSFGKEIINPAEVGVCQSIETHLKAFAPLGTNVNHGHMNSASFYVLKGRGHDIQDGVRYQYEAGDMLFVPNGVQHQHFNDSPDDEMIVLIMKAKPLFLFMHMLFQKTVDLPPNTPIPGHEDYEPPTDL